MKRSCTILSFLVAALLVCTCFAGCTSSPVVSSAPTATSTNSATVAPSTTPTSQPTETLNYWIIGAAGQKDQSEVWAEFNKQLQKSIPNTTIKFNVVSNTEYKTKWDAAMAAQEQIDLAWTGWVMNLQDEANKGNLKPLNDLIAKYGKDITKSLGQTVLDIHKLSDGNLYQVIAWQGLVGERDAVFFPTELSNLVGGSSWVSAFQQVGYDNWQTTDPAKKQLVWNKLEEYLAAAKTAGHTEGYGIGTLDEIADWMNTESVYKMSYGDIYNDNYAFYVERNDNTFTVKAKVESDLYKMECKNIADFYSKGLIRSDIASYTSTTNDWTAAKSYKNTYACFNHLETSDSAAKTYSETDGFDISMAWMNPNFTYQKGDATGTSIPSTCSDPNRAMMVMNYLYSDDGKNAYNTYVYGIEGKHYTTNSDGTIKTLCGDGQATSDWDYGEWKWTLGTCLNAYLTQTDTATEYTDLKKAEDTALKNPLVSFNFDNTKVQTQLAQLKALGAQYGDELRRGYLGSNWEAEYNKYVAKLKSAGLDKVLAEIQSQVNAYVAKNGSKW
jgi:putative aldouronate transport system substrate-binding protein